MGDNVSNFEPGELLLLGNDLPHMWRCDEKYFQMDPFVTAEGVVVQFLPDFVGKDFLDETDRPRDNSITVETQCFESGFNNRSNFFGHFKRITGLTPLEYKRKCNFDKVIV